MWFVEENANKVGRITAAGQLQEIALPPTSSSVEGPVQDLDVAPDGSVWVITEHGENLVRLSSTGQLISNWTFPNYDGCVGDTCPYGGDVRVGTGRRRVGHDELRQLLHRQGHPDRPARRPPTTRPSAPTSWVRPPTARMWCQNGNASAQDVVTHVGRRRRQRHQLPAAERRDVPQRPGRRPGRLDLVHPQQQRQHLHQPQQRLGRLPRRGERRARGSGHRIALRAAGPGPRA